ncbi:hypothetical protein E2C01_043749 [Portunus trituberculatus]|uniref:Uncharacterized protein n=1 Tax=Portunus trituberculatus TaxID=210409 RepID=A0A5B7FX76_PORTR|nr:hypothetical protein [Portunus trituberculatus]
MVGAGSPQTLEALPKRRATLRLNPLTRGPATEKTRTAEACRSLNPRATPGSEALHQLIPHTPRAATLGSGAALKLTPPKPEKSAEEPETSHTRERGRTHANSTKPRKLRGRARNSGRRHLTRYQRWGRAQGHTQTHSPDRQLRSRAWNRGSLPPQLIPGAKPGKGFTTISSHQHRD